MPVRHDRANSRFFDELLAAQQFHGPMFMMMGAEADVDLARRFCAQHLEAFNEAHGRKA